jgi:hypothetical protein
VYYRHIYPLLFLRINYLCYLQYWHRYLEIQGPFAKFVDSPYYSESELCGGAVIVSFLKYLQPLLENMLQIVCHKLQEDSGAGGFDLGAPISWVEKPRNLMG